MRSRSVFLQRDLVSILSTPPHIFHLATFTLFCPLSYSDPDRANLYLGGGAIPQNSQSIAYLLRNDVLTNVEDMRAEVAYLLKVLRKGEGELELEDILAMSKMGKEGMAKYLDLVPPKELEAARSKFAAA